MIIAILLAALVIWGAVATIVELLRGGLRPVTTDWSRVAEHDRATTGPRRTHRLPYS